MKLSNDIRFEIKNYKEDEILFQENFFDFKKDERLPK